LWSNRASLHPMFTISCKHFFNTFRPQKKNRSQLAVLQQYNSKMVPLSSKKICKQTQHLLNLTLTCHDSIWLVQQKDNHRENIPRGSLSTMFQAEVMAILRSTQLLLSKNVKRRRIYFCSDSNTHKNHHGISSGRVSKQ